MVLLFARTPQRVACVTCHFGRAPRRSGSIDQVAIQRLGPSPMIADGPSSCPRIISDGPRRWRPLHRRHRRRDVTTWSTLFFPSPPSRPVFIDRPSYPPASVLICLDFPSMILRCSVEHVNFFQFIGFDIDATEAQILANKETNHAHFPPSDEPLSWDTKGRAVTLDMAIMAAHLMTGRLIFGGVRSLMAQGVRLAQAKIQEKVTDMIGLELGTALGASKRVASLAFEMVQIWDDDWAQGVLELKIRRESLTAQRDLWHSALAQRTTRRRTKRVLTRHASKKQRKANKRWQRAQRRKST